MPKKNYNKSAKLHHSILWDKTQSNLEQILPELDIFLYKHWINASMFFHLNPRVQLPPAKYKINENKSKYDHAGGGFKYN